ncbi:hypothetical protein [Chelatococcus sp. CO-6]|uniref:hypothetical protein n=1 Tax=Chelatococcus sp. CO-6 TaxID=1702325 RepID=UPI0018D0B8F5|nr:hypothetical protein [Chelatococcus sp. CO-6]
MQGDLQTRVINANSALEVGNQILGILAKDPAVVGPTGNTRRLLQDATDVFGSVATVFGGQQQLVGEIDRARQDLVQTLGPQAQTLLPELFNPNLNSIETLNGFLVYKVAEASGSPGGAPATKTSSVSFRWSARRRAGSPARPPTRTRSARSSTWSRPVVMRRSGRCPAEPAPRPVRHPQATPRSAQPRRRPAISRAVAATTRQRGRSNDRDRGP